MTTLDLRINLTQGAFALDLDQTLPLSGLTAVFGPSGSGKSTLLRVIAGFQRAGGRLAFAGAIWDEDRRFVPPHKRRVATVFQQHRLFAHLTVAKNLEFAARRSGQMAAVPAAVDRFDLGSLLERRTTDLSGGEAQRVALARALLSDPQLILMDEPLSALDQKRRTTILLQIEKLRDDAGIPILYVSHDTSEVARLATNVLTLANGRAMGFGPATEILNAAIASQDFGAMEPGCLISARVSGMTPDGLCRLEFPGGTILSPERVGETDAEVRLFIRARDVIIARERPTGLSALNILPAVVTRIDALGVSADLVLSCGGIPLRASITRRSVAALGLEPGSACFAILKTVALAQR
ncbi:MAG: molybdenum ABC transporter ATP-binding protein [Albidovulum sp.]